MRKKKSEDIKGNKVIAIVQDDSKYKAVCLSTKGNSLQLVWLKSSDVEQMNFSDFAAECGLNLYDRAKRIDGRSSTVVAGFNSMGVIFYRLKIPAVKEDEICRIVNLQTEARLPLPVEQVERAYRTGNIQNGQAFVTVAAAKRENLQRFVEGIKFIEPAKIILDCEGLVKTWWNLFSESRSRKPAVLVSICDRSTKICLVEAGKLINATILDMGMDDIEEQTGLNVDSPVYERFARDINSIVQLFGFADTNGVSLYVISRSKAGINIEEGVNEFKFAENIVSVLSSLGLDAKICDFRFPVSNYLLSTDDSNLLYEYRVPVGLGLMVLDEDKGLDLFANIYTEPGSEKKKRWLYSLKAAAVVTGVMLVLAIIMFYYFDTAYLRHLNELKVQIDYGKLVAKQELMQSVAGQRPDLLGLFSELSSVEAGGIMLSEIDFKMGQPIKIKGTVEGDEKLYKFQEDILAKENFKKVSFQSGPPDKKTKKLNFTMTFSYKNYSEKGI